MSDYGLQQAISRAIIDGVQNGVQHHPMVMKLLMDVKTLQDRLAAMERCCVCVKVNAPMERVG